MIPNRTAAKTSDPRPLNLENVVVFAEVCLATGQEVSDIPTSPTLSTGAGAPTHTRPNGSVFFRTDGGADTTVYARSGGAWVAVEASGGDIKIPDDKDIYFGDDDDGTLGYNNATDDLVLNITSGDLKFTTTTTGNIEITPADDLVVTATGSDVDIDADTLTVDMTGAISLDGVGNSNLTIDNGDLTLQTTTAGEVVINGIGGIDIDAANNIAIDGTANYDLTIAGDATWDIGGDIDLATDDSTAGGADPATGGAVFGTGDRHLNDAAGSPQSGDMTIDTGASVVDNGAGAATGGPSGNIVLQTGNTNCDDAAGTAGDSGDLTLQTGDADSNAGTSGDSGALTVETGFSDDGDSGALTLQTGTAGTDSGDVVIDVGAAGGNAGDVIVGDTARAVQMGSLVVFDVMGGADPANALLAGIGTSGDPATTAVVGANMLEFRVQTTATSGDFRGLYIRADFDGDGVSGEGIRSNCVSDQDVAGTVNGIHASFEIKSGGDVSGAAQGGRFGFIVPNDASISKGTVAGAMSEIYLAGTSSVLGATQHSLHRFVTDGADAATRDAQVEYLFSVEGHTSTSGGLFYANAGTVGAKKASFKVVCPDGTDGWIWIYDAEA